MPKPYQTPPYLQSAPKRLQRAWKDHPSYQRLSRELDVNKSYLHDALARGIEPTNPEIRARMFYPEKAFKDLPLGDKRFRHIRWWSRLTKEQRNSHILFLYHYKENDHVS